MHEGQNLGPKLLDRFSLNVACLITSTVRHHVQKKVVVTKGRGVGRWANFSHHVLLVIFGSFDAPTAFNAPTVHHEKLNAPTKYVSVGGVFTVFLCGQFAQLVSSYVFSPQNHFQ